MAQKKMILDLDTGVDDALAIAYAVVAPDVDLIGIVSSYGNNLLDVCAKNSLKLLELLGQTDVPVYKGLPHSSTSDHFDVMQVSKDIHGDNGIGDVDLPEPKRALEEMSGVDFYIEAAHQYGPELIIIPTGPMTNLAAALEKDPEIAHLIGNVTFMGGALTVEGNVTDVAEANIVALLLPGIETGINGIVAERGMGVFNGDLGMIRSINPYTEVITVEFEEGKFADYTFKQADELELAYATTIHKAQGSEYPAVVIPLLSGPSMLMNRNLLYTAVTRARKCVTLVGNEVTFEQMVQNTSQQKRYSGLCDRLKEA